MFYKHGDGCLKGCLLIKGIGVDLVENERIKNLIQKWGQVFLDKVFLPEEIEYCSGKRDFPSCFAARIACKEAVFKAFGTEKLTWKDVKVVKTLHGAPQIKLLGNALAFWEKSSLKHLNISLSHSRNYSIAVATIEM